MTRRSGLGRGLDSLIPSPSTDPADPSEYREIPLGEIVANQWQPRTTFDEESLAGLAASIAELGVIQPIIVRTRPEGGYELIAGERRWRAAKRARLATIPAIVRTAEELASLEQAVVENLHRDDLHALEEASAYQQLIEEFSLTQEQVAQRVGKSRSAVANAIRLFQLPPLVQQMVANRELSAGHARTLLGTPDRVQQEALARKTVSEQLSVRDLETLVKGEVADDQVDESADTGAGEPSSNATAVSESESDVLGDASSAADRPPALLELEELLAEHFETRVAVTMRGRVGKLTIDFADLDDLERIYGIIASPAAKPSLEG